MADAIAADALHTVGEDLDHIFKPEFDRIDATAREIHSTRSTRSDLRERLASVQGRAGAALAALASRAGGN